MKTVKITALCLILYTPLFAFKVAPNDSLVNEDPVNTGFVKHVVSLDETLYSLLKKYDCSAEQVFLINPDLRNKSNIYVNQVIKFPVHSSIVSSRKPLEIKPDELISTVHHVLPKETLYSISKKYGVDIDELKRVNNIEENGIQIGQSIVIRTTIKEYNSNLALSIPNSFPDDKKPDHFVVPNAPMGEKVSELGIAEVIKTDRNSNKMLALHKNAPLGSLMTVKNEATGDRVVVKVIGKLPDTGNNNNVLVRLSPSAFYKLNPKDIRIRAEVAYFLPPNM